MLLTFNWDARKASANLKKHGVSFEEATTAFGDALSLTIRDPEHSDNEERFLLLGMTTSGRLVVVSHSDQGDNIRVISVRLATRRERTSYENG